MTLPARPRKPRVDNGQATRAAILHAAQQVFVELGYENTTARAIAKRAGCNHSLISRYFGGKAELFAIIVRNGPIGEGSKHSLLDAPVRYWGRELVRSRLRITGQASPDDLYDLLLMLLRSAASARGAGMLNEFLAREDTQLTPEHLAGPDAPLRAMLVQAQLVGLTLMREIVRVPELRDADVDTIADYLGPALQQLLQPDRQAAASSRTRSSPT